MRTPQSVGAKWPKMLQQDLLQHHQLFLNSWHKAAWIHVFMLFTLHLGPTNQMSQWKSWLVRLYSVFFPPSLQSLYCPIMVLFCKLNPQFPVFHWYEWHAGTLWPICINIVQHFADSPVHSLEAASGGCDFLYALFHLSDSDHHGYISKPFVLIWIFGFNFSLSSLPRLHG